MKKETIEKIKRELERVKAQDPDGLIKPEAVVEFAKNPKTELHKHFTWDVDKAAQRYWVEQARAIIQEVRVTIIHNDKEVEHRCVISLMPDRKQPGGGYRMLEDVMNDKQLHKEYLRTALLEFQALKRKYEKLTELEPVFSAIQVVETRLQGQVKKPVTPPKKQQGMRPAA